MISRVPVTETYRDVEKLIYKEVGSFQKRFGGDFDELLSEANLAFMRAYKAYDLTRGEFTTLLVTSIRHGMMNVLRSRMKANSRKTVSLDAVGCNDTALAEQLADEMEPPKFDLESFAKGLTKDAKTVIEILLDTPTDLESAFFWAGGEERHWKSSIRQYLQSLGWTAVRVKESFLELKVAMS